MGLSSIKGINRLKSKGMPNNYLNITIEKKKAFLKLLFSVFAKFVSSSVFRELQLTQISLHFKTSCCNLKTRAIGVKLVSGFSIAVILIGIMAF